jgi:hypothetical protein
LKIYTGDTFVIATKIPFFNETLEEAPIYQFTIHLDSVKDITTTKNILTHKIGYKIVELRNVSTDRHGKIYATVFLAEENINNWLLQNKYAIPYNRKLQVKPKITDCFLSHNWGENNKNHIFVKNVHLELQKKGLKTWFDENEIDGNIRFRMAEGIDNTKCFVVFITKEYRNKVNGIDMTDNCKYEFSYAMNQLGSQNMIPIVLETEIKDTKKWKGELGAALGNMLYIDFTSDFSVSDIKYEEIYQRIKKLIDTKNDKLPLIKKITC